MGSCWGSPVDSRIQSSTSSNLPSSPGTLNSSAHYFTSVILDEAFPNGKILSTPNLKIFSFSELKSATRNFRPDTVLGEGGFGRVFKGWLDEKTYTPSKIGTGMVVAVKKLNSESMQGFEEWQGSLVQPLSWALRLKIVIGAARGLAFLHTSEKQIIYRDFKASNILLDANFDAKISDFGLAKNGPSAGDSHVTTRIMGTYGYAAPEYVATGHLYVKSDVYGFGVVLLEILTGQRALDMNRPNGQQKLVDLAKPFLLDRRKLKTIMDSRLDGQYPLNGAAQAAQLASTCLAEDPKSRPSMKEVVEKLERIEAIKEKSRDTRTGSRQPNRHQSQQHHPLMHHHRSPRHPGHSSADAGTGGGARAYHQHA